VTLKKTNTVQFLGMSVKNLNQEQKEYFDLDQGVIINDLNNRRLYRYGIDEGFVILEINNKKIEEVADVEAIDLKSLNSLLFLKPNGERERIIFE
jgi:S1-C subfamily serine protease